MHIASEMRFPPSSVRRVTGALLLAVAAATTALGAQVQGCAPARTALVLGGGGAKGLTHIGLLQALDSLGIVPDLIVGTSMGALVGALYASGESGATVQTLMRQFHLDEIIRDYDPVVSTSLSALKSVVVWERAPSRWVLQVGAVREGEVSALLSRMTLKANLLARGDFDSLPIPFRAVATDLDSRAVVSLGTGDLALALRASMSLPIFFRPVVIDGRALVDGGLASNIPVAVARRLGAERIIVSTIASAKPDASAFDDPLTVTSAVFDYLWVQDSFGLGPEDVLVAQPTAAYSPLDFRPVMIDSLVRLGRRTADAAFAGAACLRPLSTTRRPITLPATVGHARIAASDVRDRDAILREVSLAPRAPLDLLAVDAGLARFAMEDRYRGLWLNPSGDSTHTDFDLTVDRAPARSFGLGFVFDHWMSARLWMGTVDHALFHRDLEGTALLTTGTYRTDLTLAARRRARVGQRYVPVGGSLEIATEAVRRYQGNGELPTSNTDEITAIVGLRPLFELGWTQELGADYRLWREPGVPLRGTAGVRYAARLRRASAPDPLITLEAIGLRAWQRVRLDLSRSDTVRGVELRPRIRVGWGKDLPLQQTFALGGLDGFAGQRLLEERGDHELFGSLLIRWPLWRRVLGRIEPMAGLTGVGAFTPATGNLTDRLRVGARVGVELETPIGPIRVEQGFNNQNRRQALIRVGYWF